MKLPLFTLLCALSVSACAQPNATDADKTATADKAGDTPSASTAPAPVAIRPADSTKEANVRAALKKVDPTIEADWVGPAPLPGFQEAIVAGQVIYISDDGRYMLQGMLYDIDSKKDLSQTGISVLRREQLKTVPVSDRIVFGPVGPVKHTVAVFTDIECGYCRKLHAEIGEYNKRGIEIQYLAFPRAGLKSPDGLAMESVWCSADRRKALTDAKSGQDVAPKSCDNPVAAQYEIGQRIGLQGTPMLVTASGVALPGYLPPDEMLKTLDKIAAETPMKPAATGGTH